MRSNLHLRAAVDAARSWSRSHSRFVRRLNGARRPVWTGAHAAVTTFVIMAVAASAHAHFPFIVPSKDGATARLIMSETLTPDDAVELGLLSAARLVVRDKDGAEVPLASPRSDEPGDAFSLALPGSGTRVVRGVVDLGVMQRGASPAHILVYYPKTVLGNPFDRSTELGARTPIEFKAEIGNHCYHLRLLVDGVPAADTEMHLIHEDGRDLVVRTDAEGRTPPLMPGRIAAWARSWIDERGERDGRAYAQVRRYATYVADLPDPHGMPARAPALPAASVAGGKARASDAASTPADDAGAAVPALDARPISRAGVPVAPLPRAVASFGATELDGWLYVYGGHAGVRHDYSTASVSGRLSRAPIDAILAGDAQWEELPGGAAVQGMNLVSHRGRILRAGGMEPRNAAGEAADNHSVCEVAAYEPAARRWTTLPAMPEPRSSHDLVVVGDTLVVVGGWNMAGSRASTRWIEDALFLDLEHPERGWESVPQPFKRRALIAAAIGDEVFVIGGFDESDQAHVTVEVLHVPTRRWSTVASLPVDERAGFAPAAAVFEGRLHVGVASGDLYALSDDRASWTVVAQTTPRIVHRMVAEQDGILVIGGAREAAMSDLIEHVALRPGAKPVAPVAQAESVGTSMRGTPASVPWSYPDTDELARTMSAIDDDFTRLEDARRGGWAALVAVGGVDVEGGAPAELVRAAERIHAHLASVRGRDAGAPEPFVAMLRTGVDSAERLRSALAPSSVDGTDARRLDGLLDALKASCRDCHRQYR